MTKWMILAVMLLALMSGERAALASDVPDSDAALEAEHKEPPPRVRFRDKGKPVKVIVLAGSIGAYRKQPYAEHIAEACAATEVENLSKTGFGTWALKRRFMEATKHNRFRRTGIDRDRPDDYSFWLLYGGGLNSVGTPEKTNKHARELIMHAHERGMRVVAFTLTPWGEERDPRWRGLSALRYFRATKKVSDFLLGRLSPEKALGRYVRERTKGSIWSAKELPDVAVNLYDSELRHKDAQLRAREIVQRRIETSATWRRRSRELSETQRAKKLSYAVDVVQATPQWFMKPKYQGFDDIHPNAEGHKRIAQIACPELPKSWQCNCQAIH